MTDPTEIARIRACAPLLPPPGDRVVADLCDEVDRLRALADPDPVGLTEDERRWLVATTTDLVNGYSDDVHWARPTITRLLAIIDRLSAAPEPAEEAAMPDHNWDFPTDLPEAAWGLIASAFHGDWSQASDEWREAAERWRDAYHDRLSAAPVDDRERVPEGWRVEWLIEEPEGPGCGPRSIPYLDQIPMAVSPSVDPEEGKA